MPDAQHLGRGLGHLVAPDREQAARVDIGLGRRIEHVATLAARAGHDHDVDPLGDVLGRRGRALAGLVVRVGVHGHQSEGACHGDSLHHVPTPFTRDQLSPAMQERYGLDRRPVGRWIGSTILAIVFAGILAYVFVGLTSSSIDARLVTWDDVAADRVDITIQVRRDGQPMPCSACCGPRTRGAIDVGYATVDIPPGKPEVVLDYSLRTLAPAYTAELLGCAAGGPPAVPPPQFPPGVVPPAYASPLVGPR